jgi:2-dehydropantoate 2-reductase
MNLQKRICVIGAGAIGGVLAGLLARAKYRVELVTRHEDLAEKIRSSGIEVSGHCGEFSVQVPSVASPEKLEGAFDYVLIATKADALVQAATRMLPHMNGNTQVVSLQNGICEEMLAGVVGEERTVGCVVGWGGTMHAPGRVEMTSGGEFVLGNWNRGNDVRLKELAEVLGTVIPTRISGHILSELYSKLIINSCITTLGAICGLYLGEMLAKRKARDLFIGVIREAIRVADAMDLRVAPAAGGRLDYYKFLSPGPLSAARRHLLIRLIGMKYRRLKSSSLQSLERGRKTEVDNYNGYISARGKEFGIETPVNDFLAGMVREIEQGKRLIGPDNFSETGIG